MGFASLRTLSFDAQLRHATPPAQGSSREGAWDAANSPRLLL
ncbi:hypothetical protein DSOL_1863 [Desulfosporosinus metallidurans]|uniref:Uncharacterized protein n=1 Tax=Desulfosporosinus metallidurans TaxID=1888891 RepID=A0A1Q8QY51_9FIRM|nr:hypothetical protein DSOL_1863 [Desulfosporosinus metallidurans]